MVLLLQLTENRSLLIMYSRQESAQLKKEFWTAFGQYMMPVVSAEGEKVNWMNYKTGVKDIYFRMQADSTRAQVAIIMTHKDPDLQQIFFEQFEQFKGLLHQTLNEQWTWALHDQDEYGKTISRIYKEIRGPGIFRKDDWPSLISFFKPRIIALDEFWSQVRYGFEDLR